MRDMRTEWSRREYTLFQCEFDWREREKIRSEINTNYTKYKKERYCVHISYGLDGYSYEYYFVNRGFDDYFFYARIPSEE